MPNKSRTGAVQIRDKTNGSISVIYYRSVGHLNSEAENLAQYTGPNILLLSETWLDSSMISLEFLPSKLKGGIKKDGSKEGGGVMISYSLFVVEA